MKKNVQRYRARLAGTVLAAAVSMTAVEFVEFQKLSSADLRTRFKLSTSCDPSVTAVATDPAVNVVTVAIECRARPGSPLPPAGPGDRPGSPGPSGRGS